MAEQIVDGTGTGIKAKVSAGNQLHVYSASVPYQHHVAHTHSEAFIATVQQTPTTTNTPFAYLKNTYTEDINIWTICARCAAAECIEVWSVTGTAVGTEYVPVNAVIGSGILANVTCVVNNAITGLAKAKLIKRIYVEAATRSVCHDIHTAIILPAGQAVAVYAVTGTALTDIEITFDFHSVE